MLLFIKVFNPIQRAEDGFNTSHVVIYLSAEAAQYAIDNSFNTSHVVIYLIFNI